MKRARCLSFWICLRIIQHFKIHAKVQYTTVTSSAQSKLNCNIIAMSAARFSHLLVIWCLLSNTKCATWKVETIWNSLSLSIFIYIYMACIVSSFFAEIMGNLRGPSYIFHFTTTLSIHADTGEVPQASATFGRETAVPPTVCVVFLCFFWMGLMGFFASIPGGQVEKVNLLDFQNYTWHNFEDASDSS